MKEMISTNMEETSGQSGSISRRDLLKLGGFGALGLVLSELGLSNVSQEFGHYEVVSGIKVYGLEKPYQSKSEVDKLTLSFDLDFESKLPKEYKSLNVWEQREKMLPENKRYVQFVVRESVYRSFVERQLETGVDLATWLKLHTDLMNRMAKTADIPVDLTTEISRIVVVADSFQTNPVSYTKDIDAMWFLDKDYRVDQAKEIGQGYFWSFKKNNGDLDFRNPPEGNDIWKRYKVKNVGVDSYDSVGDGVWVDIGLVHELIHQTWNLPDEYVFDDINSPFRFLNTQFRTGYFQEPYLSCYSSILLREMVKRKVRGYYMHPLGIGFNGSKMDQKYFHHSEIPTNFSFAGSGITGCELYKTTFASPDYYSDKNYVYGGPGVIKEAIVRFNKSVLSPQATEKGPLYPTLMYLKFLRAGQKDKDLFLPLAVLNMAKLSGEDVSDFNVEFDDKVTGDNLNTQFVELVHDSKIDEFMRTRTERNYLPYAKMRINGAGVWVIWSLQK